MSSPLFTLVEIQLHGKIKYELVWKEGGKHIAYFNDKGEAQTVLRLLLRN